MPIGILIHFSLLKPCLALSIWEYGVQLSEPRSCRSPPHATSGLASLLLFTIPIRPCSHQHLVVVTYIVRSCPSNPQHMRMYSMVLIYEGDSLCRKYFPNPTPRLLEPEGSRGRNAKAKSGYRLQTAAKCTSSNQQKVPAVLSHHISPVHLLH